jgi:hypothetical protein
LQRYAAALYSSSSIRLEFLVFQTFPFNIPIYCMLYHTIF